MALPWQKNQTDLQKPVSLATRRFSFSVLFKWLVSLLTATKEDQERAGVYLNGEGRN